MTPEDRLRELLRDGEPSVGPGSFDDVRSRARRQARRGRALVAGGLALVVGLAAVVAVPLLDDDEPPQQVIADPGPTSSTVPTTTVPAMDESVGIWPFVTAAEADDKAIELSFNPTSATAVAVAFLSTFAGMEARGPATEPEAHDVRERAVRLSHGGGGGTTVELRRIGSSDRWTVVGAEADGLVLDAPAVGGGSVRVTGRATAFEGTVVVSVLDRGRPPTLLGRAPVTGEQGELRPFAGEVRFDPGPGTLGVVVAVTESAEDGSVEQVAAVPVRWDAAVGGLLAAVLVEDVPDDPDLQDVVLLDPVTGAVRRTLVESFGTAEGSILDLDVGADGEVFVALSTSACESEVRAIDVDGVQRSLGSGERVAVSPDGRQVAVWVRERCGEREYLEVRTTDGAIVRGNDTTGQVGRVGWIDGNTIVYEADGTVWEVRRGEDPVELEPPDGLTWEQPVGETVVVRGDGEEWVATRRDGPALTRTAPDIVSYTVRGTEVFWVTADGQLRDRRGELLRTDVALVAS
jgi:hypothetical protein